MIKNHKSLDNIRNSIAGHIQIDFRIACAMLNFFHKPCCPDSPVSVEIARRLKLSTYKKTNNLAPLLKQQFNTNLMTPIMLTTICDFPKIKVKALREKIAYGTFQVKQAKSYIKDLINEGTAYILQPQHLSKSFVEANPDLKQIKDSVHKIISIGIPSRHKRSIKKSSNLIDHNTKNENFYTLYKVLVCYQPYFNGYKGIKGN